MRPSAIRSVLLVLLFAPLVASWWPAVALANDSSIGATGGSIYPIWTTDVRLAAETVQATCFGGFAEYRVDFLFINEGRAQKVKLGFPFTDTIAGESGSERPIGFQAWQDGTPLRVKAVPARSVDGEWTEGYFVHEAIFRRGATTITVSYLAQGSGEALDRMRGAEPGDPGFGFAGWHEYWLHTGATWKGPIGEAIVRYRLADTFTGHDIEATAEDVNEGAPVTSPSGWTTPLPRSYQWQFTDFEPTPSGTRHWWGAQSPYDVTLGFTGAFEGPPTKGKWTWSSAATRDEAVFENIQDGDLVTCWAEGAPGPGVGEWALADFNDPVRLRELRILPGNNEYPSAFGRYARPKRLTAVFSDGSSVALRLRDAPSLQRFPVDVTTKSVKFVVESVYLGSDYPATCIAEVEFGTREAPGYAPFARLIRDADATGRLPSWAGPPAPEPRSRAVDWFEERDADTAAGGDLIGVDLYVAFLADEAPFKEPVPIDDLRERVRGAPLPEEDLVGDLSEVNALSYWTYEVRYDSGIDLLVNTRVSGVPHKSVLAELQNEAECVESYEDGRALPYEVLTIGDAVVGVARPGTIVSSCSSSPSGSDGSDGAWAVPGQVFWRDGDTSYHLYARSEEVSTEDLVQVATSLIDPSLMEAEEPALSSTARGWLVTLGAVAVAVVAFGWVVRRRARQEPGSQTRGSQTG